MVRWEKNAAAFIGALFKYTGCFPSRFGALENSL
jgi:hypothetical protein